MFFAFFWTGFALVLGSLAVMTGDIRHFWAMCLICGIYFVLFTAGFLRARRRWLDIPSE